MATTDENTNSIDSKKQEKGTESSGDENVNYGEFIGGLLRYSISSLIIFAVFGSFGLYVCKIAQANVLPDNTDYKPFGSKTPNVEQIPINTNVIKEYGFHGFGWMLGEKPKIISTKIVFNGETVTKDYEEGGIGFINSLQSNPKRASYFGLYIRDILFNMISNNNWMINKMYSVLNESLSESIIVFLYPFLMGIIYFTLFFTNFCLSFYYQLKYWKDFFMDKHIKKDEVEWHEPFTYLRPLRSFLFFLYLIFFFFPMVCLLPIGMTLYTFLSPLFITGKVENTNTKVNFISFMKDVVLYKSQMFLVLLTFGLISQSGKSLGTNGMVGALVGTAIVFFMLNLYNPYIPKHDPNFTPGLVPFKQAKKAMTGGGKKMKFK